MSRIVQVALPVPLHRSFDFTIPTAQETPQVGVRIRVPFGRRRLVGMVTRLSNSSAVAPDKLRELDEILDTAPVFPEPLMAWLKRVAEYYHHPFGEVLHTALPTALRRGTPLEPRTASCYRITLSGRSADPGFRRAPLRQRIWDAFRTGAVLAPSDLETLGRSWQRTVRIMIDNGWVETTDPTTPVRTRPLRKVELNAQQSDAVDTIVGALGAYQAFVLFGVTGSGKTEVYLESIRHVIARGGQVLVLVPEIGLTPQLVKRFEQSVDSPLAVMHSGLSAAERHRAWAAARCGSAAIVLGTRSAVFTPLKNPGLIIVDEEHDLSFKQQEGLRYHARDIAVLRGKQEAVPIVLGSATPSFESMANVSASRYRLLRLGARVQGARLPRIDPIDMRAVPITHGLSRTLVGAIGQRLQAGEQSLIYINRRGYAPVLYCTTCGWQASCERCDTRLIYHKSDRRLRCHHCGLQRQVPDDCPECCSNSIKPLGEGTQRLESHLTELFPSARILRIDRDSTRRKGELEQRLDQAASGEADILVGTQLLSKGHHFPMVTLVGVIDADQGLYSVDFRATEYLFQQIVQVAGRAGRAGHPGQVLVQTMHPDHFHFSLLKEHDYAEFVKIALGERERAGHPPYSHFVLLRAESTMSGAGLSFLSDVRDLARPLARRWPAVEIMEPVPSPMEKRAGRYRAQLLISSSRRPELHALISDLCAALEEHDITRRVRWSIDVDPMEMY